MSRTFAIGDIHGERAALDRLLGKLPLLTASDTIVFIGDYVDRGPDSRGVIERVRSLAADGPAKVVSLRGNHEEMWLECWDSANLGFLLPRGNGTLNTYRSFTQGRPIALEEEIAIEELERLCSVRSWFPAEVHDWMAETQLWYEDEHAIYVHAGVEHDETGWKHPSMTAPKLLMWMRQPNFFRNYHGKRLLFGHTPTRDIQPGTTGIWQRGDLIGIDTGAGKGGHLSAIELPSLRIYDSREDATLDTATPLPLVCE